MSNKNLYLAKKKKNDEFFTSMHDIEAELLEHKEYAEQFADKIIYCNCDTEESNFVKFFVEHFKEFKLKKLICTHVNLDGQHSDKTEWIYNNGSLIKSVSKLKGNGDFRSNECVKILEQCDIVATNPPFSLFREFIELSVNKSKKIIVLGSLNLARCKNIFPLIKENLLSIGYNTGQKIFISGDETIKFGNVIWYTNMPLDKSHKMLKLSKTYCGNESHYPFYDNYNAINVDKISDIPCDYFEPMGVPVTYLFHHCEEQFKILGITSGNKDFDAEAYPAKYYINPVQINKDGSISNGSKANTNAGILLSKPPNGEIYYSADNADGPIKMVYARIIIKRKK